ncbi:hypothetical protein [Acidianus brierleyi]|uniref:Uncharacterized protein n=1 Tax=Acidianus brierleyi TaxID=41673 RepID=A0A2U9IC39_9CREN|nr:hypothetical protein [Acidianus brierleyi]AWR93579.1 hypothetical protein DFR85_02110 [Acidianus brierleyi]
MQGFSTEEIENTLKFSGLLVTKIDKISNGVRFFINGKSYIDLIYDGHFIIYYFRKIACSEIDKIRQLIKHEPNDIMKGFYITEKECFLLISKSSFKEEELAKKYIELIKIADSIIDKL